MCWVGPALQHAERFPAARSSSHTQTPAPSMTYPDPHKPMSMRTSGSLRPGGTHVDMQHISRTNNTGQSSDIDWGKLSISHMQLVSNIQNTDLSPTCTPCCEFNKRVTRHIMMYDIVAHGLTYCKTQTCPHVLSDLSYRQAGIHWKPKQMAESCSRSCMQMNLG